MDRNPNNRRFKLSSIWTCHRSIESSCTKGADALLVFLNGAFADMLDEMDNALNFAGTGGNERAISDDSITSHRSSVDRIRMLMHINGMQLEVARRVVQSKQDRLNALAAEKSRTILLANLNRSHRRVPLPILPSEILALIFSYSYWSSKAPRTPRSHDNFVVDNRTVLQRLLDDDGTPDVWKNFISEQIPCVVTTFGIEGDLKMFADHFGYHPRLLALQDSPVDLDNVLEKASTIIAVNLHGGSKVIEELEVIRQKPWHNVLITEFGNNMSPTAPRDVVGGILRKFGDKLIDLGRLTFFEQFIHHTYYGAQASALVDSNTLDGLTNFKLTFARSPSHLLPAFRPIHLNISELEIAISFPNESGSTASEVDHLFQAITMCSRTLTSIKITNVRNPGTLVRSQARRRGSLSLPLLKRLSLELFGESIALEIISAIHCPSLSRLDLSIYPQRSRDTPRSQSTVGANDHLSANLLHTLFPGLEYISVRFGNFSRDTRLLSDLARPNISGSWIFPLLDSMKFTFGGASLAHMRLLKAVANVVINRAQCNSTRNIRFLSIPEFTGEGSARCDVLRLLVPEMQFTTNKDRIQVGRW